MKIHLYGGSPERVRPVAEALVRDLGEKDPEVLEKRDPVQPSRDLGTAVSLASLIISLPGVVLTGLQIKERLGRKRLAYRIETLKARLEEFDTEAELNLTDRTAVDLRRAATDDIVDILTR